MNKQLIIARYNEDISWLNKVKIPYLIYDKSTNDKAPNSIHLDNLNREDYVYLYHIINNYDSLYDITIFSQADPFPHIHIGERYVHDEVIDEFVNTLDNLNINKFTPLTKMNNCICLDGCISSGEDLPINSFYKDLFGVNPKLSPYGMPEYDFCVGAIFAVPKAKILQHSKEFYEKCLSMALSGKYTAPHSSYGPYKNNCAPWVLERLWGYIFN